MSVASRMSVKLDLFRPVEAGNCPTPTLCPLTDVKPGTSVRIKQLSASKEITNRLRELGFCEEQRIKLLAKSGQIICQVCNTRLGISDRLAKTILVEPMREMVPAA